jgi:hypothetical protein
VLLWLQLCVLEDKLARLQQLLQAGPDGVTALIQVWIWCDLSVLEGVCAHVVCLLSSCWNGQRKPFLESLVTLNLTSAQAFGIVQQCHQWWSVGLLNN